MCGCSSRRRHLLEWVPAAQATIGPRLDLVGFYRRMAGGVARRRRWRWSVALLSGQAHGRWRCRSPRCGSPRRRSRAGSAESPAIAGRLPMSTADAQALRLIARRTWRFFETFVTAADNMLPPDNFQEDPDAGDRAPDLADQSRPLSPVGRRLRAISAGSEPPRRSNGWRRRWPPWRRPAAISRAFLQLV